MYDINIYYDINIGYHINIDYDNNVDIAYKLFIDSNSIY